MLHQFKKTQAIKLENALYIVATPIGNLHDITLRAIEVLGLADFVICEDTRISMRLFESYDIVQKKLITYNDHSEEKSREKILQFLLEGKSLALISDAGTPLISDPGYKLVNFLRSRNQKIIPIPGASSVTSALCASGLACDNFLFIGFLPASKVQKEKLLKSLPKNFTLVFFEAPSRALESLQLIAEIFTDHKICVARELTKLHEEIVQDSVNNVLQFFLDNQDKLRGEFVIIVEKSLKNKKSFNKSELEQEIRSAIAAGYTIKDLSQNLAEIYDIHKKEIYKIALLQINILNQPKK